MLSISVSVPRGVDPEQAAAQALLQKAHLKRVHLVRPLTPKINPMPESFHQLVDALGIDPCNDRDFYQVESETLPCPT